MPNNPTGQPLPVAQPFPVVERRRPNRLVIPACPACLADAVTVVSRTEYVIYARCSTCGEVWSTDKP